jgi:V8-like Glu-specific endopeptidase
VLSKSTGEVPIFLNRMTCRILQSAGPLVIVMAALTWPVHAQSLADAAKKASESSSAAKGTTRTFSDKDLKASSPTGDGLISTDGDAENVAPPGPVLSREEIVNRVMPAVVTIQTGNGTGTGFFVSRGLVLTNHHVVGESSVVRVNLSDGTTTSGQVIRLAVDADLALVDVNAGSLKIVPVPLGSYRQIQTGEEVVAIGSSLGVLRNTVTRGIVSAVRRSDGVVYVQTDAAINPGNSGGPLVDKYGRAVGVNTLKVTGAESLGFSIAIDHGRRLINGDRYVADRAAPDATRSEGVFNSPRTSESDERHLVGLSDYENVVRSLASLADYLDAEWLEYARWCGVSATGAPSGGRIWFAIWSPAGSVGGNARADCSSMHNDILDRANRVKAVVLEASERARRAGVFPGEMRDARKKYSLDYDGW